MRAHTARNLTKLELRRANGDYKNPSHHFSRNSYVSIIATTRPIFFFTSFNLVHPVNTLRHG